MTASVVALLLWLGGPPADALTVSARLTANDLKTGEPAEIVIDLKVAEGWSISDAGMPGALLQFDVPASVELVGRALTDYRELARNEFLRAPYERMIRPGETAVGFKLRNTPAADERIALNVVAYVGRDSDSWLVRKRLELPLASGAEAVPADPSISKSTGDDTLQIGEKAVAFELSRPDGTRVNIGDVLGKKPIVITTYRAFW
ncbi:MAG: hypothetical protein D6744_07085 [Planctomycetota bacterium]|nr:MAG: hypothetical protein D6744_07085 [Planctomycetota bacterium]